MTRNEIQKIKMDVESVHWALRERIAEIGVNEAARRLECAVSYISRIKNGTPLSFEKAADLLEKLLD